jgi:hypothetical protein
VWLLIFSPLWGALFINFGLGEAHSPPQCAPPQQDPCVRPGVGRRTRPAVLRRAAHGTRSRRPQLNGETRCSALPRHCRAGPIVSRTDDKVPIAVNTAGFAVGAAAPFIISRVSFEMGSPARKLCSFATQASQPLGSRCAVASRPNGAAAQSINQSVCTFPLPRSHGHEEEEAI